MSGDGNDSGAPVGLRVMSAYVDVLAALEAAQEAGEHPHALWHLRRAVDSLEAAHRALLAPGGTAIVRPGEAEPVDVPTTERVEA